MNKKLLIVIIVCVIIIITGWWALYGTNLLDKYSPYNIPSLTTKEICESGHGNFVLKSNNLGVCYCAGFAGFGCPAGYECIVINPKIADAMGRCIIIGGN